MLRTDSFTLKDSFLLKRHQLIGAPFICGLYYIQLFPFIDWIGAQTLPRSERMPTY
jgi:hypothetical protein